MGMRWIMLLDHFLSHMCVRQHVGSRRGEAAAVAPGSRLGRSGAVVGSHWEAEPPAQARLGKAARSWRCPCPCPGVYNCNNRLHNHSSRSQKLSLPSALAFASANKTALAPLSRLYAPKATMALINLVYMYMTIMYWAAVSSRALLRMCCRVKHAGRLPI
jgi:hypothetical protein